MSAFARLAVNLAVNLAVRQWLSLVYLSPWSSWLMFTVGRINIEKNQSPSYPKGQSGHSHILP